MVNKQPAIQPAMKAVGCAIVCKKHALLKFPELWEINWKSFSSWWSWRAGPGSGKLAHIVDEREKAKFSGQSESLALHSIRGWMGTLRAPVSMPLFAIMLSVPCFTGTFRDYHTLMAQHRPTTFHWHNNCLNQCLWCCPFSHNMVPGWPFDISCTSTC